MVEVLRESNEIVTAFKFRERPTNIKMREPRDERDQMR